MIRMEVTELGAVHVKAIDFSFILGEVRKEFRVTNNASQIPNQISPTYTTYIYDYCDYYVYTCFSRSTNTDTLA